MLGHKPLEHVARVTRGDYATAMTTPGKLLVYGANGYTGTLVAELARDRGLAPILAGRNAATIAALAQRLGFEHRVFGLDQPAAVDAGLADIAVVLHCAGPFVHTSQPMADACLRTGVHYLDITGEITVLSLIHI